MKRKLKGKEKEYVANPISAREADQGLTASQSIEWRRRRADFSGVKKRMKERQKEEG